MSVTADVLSGVLTRSEQDDAPAQRAKLLRGARMHWFHWLIVGLSIVLTITAWRISDQQAQSTSEERFLREADHVIELVKERMQLYESVLLSSVALIDSNGGEISYPRWLSYANSLNIDAHYPGINGIGVIFSVKPDERESFLAGQRAWRPEFRIHPDHGRDELWPITYIEPASSNIQAVGLDMAFEDNRYSAVLRASETGLPQVTGPIVLVQDARKTPGFLFYVPFYLKGGTPATGSERLKNIVGVTYAPFIMYKLMRGMLASTKRQVDVRISDAGAVLFADGGDRESAVFDPDPLFSKTADVSMYGREWHFEISTNQAFRDANANSQPLMILIGGIAIDSMLLALFLFLSQANRRALDYADLATRALKAKTTGLEKSNRDLEQFAYVASHDLKSPLNAIDKLVSWIEEDMDGRIPAASKKHFELLRVRTNRMSRLLDDLLNYARVARFDYEIESVNLKAVAEDNFGLLDRPQNFRIEAEDADLCLPRIPLELVLRNLISNAVKHHDRDAGVIRIALAEDPDYYRIRVADDGPGIPAAMHQRALEMFQTLQSRDRVEGSGMGLAMSKRVVEHYGGSLDIESDGKRGTTIILNWKKPGAGA